MSELRFDGRVALVTGAGGGLGRAYALLLASRGAAVVVNDLGGSRSGEGKSNNMADDVVNQINNNGGQAVANYDSVEDGDKLVKTALDHFGRIDIVINNAGILRDRSFARTADSDWDLVHKVHLRGAFMVTRAAWPHMKKQNYGRVIMTSSVAGVYGNFGQANYSAAKLGLVGLSNTLAIEGQRNGIHCNVIVPMAASRLTQDIFPPDLFEMLKPELIAPVVAWLCHEECADNGSIIEAAGGWAGKYRWQRSVGSVLLDSVSSKDLQLETVRDRWNQVTDLSSGEFPTPQTATIDVVEKLSQIRNNDQDNNQGGKMSAVGYESGAFDYVFSHRDVILYALGVGASVNHEFGLRFLYEGDADFAALPTFGVLPGFGSLAELVSGKVPGLHIDLAKVLHGEQYTEILSPIPTSGKLISTYKISAIMDKGSGCVILVDVFSKDAETQLDVVRNQMSVFVVGDGGFGGPRTSDQIIPTRKPPNKSPDVVKEYKTNIDQAALYRLSGDLNPLHIDPSFAALGGFDKPILHGLCSYGVAVRHVVETFARGDTNKVKACKVRFAKPVYPGQTIQTKMWRVKNSILFSCTVKETGQECLSGGWVDMKDLDEVVNDSSTSTTVMTNLKSEKVFLEMRDRLKHHKDIVPKVNAVFLWNITKNGSQVAQWVVDLKNGPGNVRQGPPDGKVDCTLTLSDEDMENIMSGKLKPQSAFMQGKLKVTGNVMLTQKLQAIIGNGAKL